MNRSLLLILGVATLLLIGAATFVVTNRPAAVATSGAATERAAPAPVAPTPAAPTPPPAVAAPQPAPVPPRVEAVPPAPTATAPVAQPSPAVAVTEQADARAKFEAWAQLLRAIGATVSAETVGERDGNIAIAGLKIAGAGQGPAWNWGLDSATLFAPGTSREALRASGAMSLRLGPDGQSREWLGQAEKIDLTVAGAAPRPFTSVLLSIGNARLALADGGQPIVVEQSDIRLNLGTGQLPTSTVRFANTELPFWGDGALGRAIRSLDLVVASTPVEGLLPVTKAELSWGLLQGKGTGRLAIDDTFALTGEFSLRASDVLAVLDAVRALQPIDEEVFLKTYSTVLGAMVAAKETAFTLRFAPDGVWLDPTSLGADKFLLAPSHGLLN